jgi:hypothetical protein
MIEEWKSFYRNSKIEYLVSNKGNIKSVHFLKNGEIKELHMKCFVDKDGYLYIGARIDKDTKFFKVHRLVAKMFLDEYSEELQVNHKDENKQNNDVTNLEMCDNKYNCSYGSRRTKLAKPIIQLDLDGNFIKEWPSIIEIQRCLGFKNASIISCCKGYLKDSKSKKVYPVHHSHGYKWVYK